MKKPLFVPLADILEAEANLLPAPTMIGEWCVSPGNVNFKVCEGLDMTVPPGHPNHGQSAIAWVVFNKDWKPTTSGHYYYRMTHLPR